MALGEQVYMRMCNQDPTVTPVGPALECYWVQVSSAEVMGTTGFSKEQYDQLFGAVISIVVTIIIVALIKKAIEM
jgi:hypothetical protein